MGILMVKKKRSKRLQEMYDKTPTYNPKTGGFHFPGKDAWGIPKRKKAKKKV